MRPFLSSGRERRGGHRPPGPPEANPPPCRGHRQRPPSFQDCRLTMQVKHFTQRLPRPTRAAAKPEHDASIAPARPRWGQKPPLLSSSRYERVSMRLSSSPKSEYALTFMSSSFSNTLSLSLR